jgi:diguanylate cyclase (GGDEF)-like protein/PAS domain S-box-containing protein
MSAKNKTRSDPQNDVLPVPVPDFELLEIPSKNNKSTGTALHTSELRYRRLFEASQDGILLLDASTGRIEDANPFMEDLLGYRQSELVGKSLWEISLFKDIAANQLIFEELKRNGYVRYEDLPLQTKLGETKQVEFVSNIYQVDTRKMIQCNIRNISVRKAQEDKVEKIHEELLASVAELQRHDHELESLYKMNDLLQSCNTQAEAFHVISLMGNEIFDHPQGCLAILQPQNQYLELVLSWGDSNLMKPNFLLDDCWALRRGQVHIVKDPENDLVCNHFASQIINGYFCVPLMVQGETMGLLSMASQDDKRFQRQQQLAVIVGDAIKMSISNLRLREKLREQALTDQLTGLGNRHFLEDNLSRELARTLSRDSTVCVTMLDIDNFKKFNDSYGHEIGDTLLQKLGEVLRDHLRPSDIKCRYGGEEFVVVLMDSSLAEVKQRLEKIRTMVKAIEIKNGKEYISGMTISIGIVEAHEDDRNTNQLLREADEALYSAKRAGRDRIVIYHPKE